MRIFRKYPKLLAIAAICLFLRISFGQVIQKPLDPLTISKDSGVFEELDQVSDTLQRDDGRPHYAFRFPDAYNDDLRNQRFQAPENGMISGILIAFLTHDFTQWTTGSPDLVVKLWPMGGDSFPVIDSEWISDTADFNEFSSSVFEVDSVWRGDSHQWVYADLSDYPILMDSGQWFHAGYTAVLEAGDSLAILADDGIPETDYASEWYNGHFVSMRTGWRGVNFFIRAVMELENSDIRILEPGPAIKTDILNPVYPNPFNAQTIICFELVHATTVRLNVYDILGRERIHLAEGMFSAGNHAIPLDASDWSSGIYFIRLLTPGSQLTRQIVVEK